jgi:type I restriction enzyme S subunit
LGLKLSEVCEITMGQSPKSEFYNSNGKGIPFLQGNRTFGEKYPVFDTFTTYETKIAQANDVIMSVRAPVGDINITPVKMCLGRGVCSLRHKQGEQEFLYYLMRYYSKNLINRESGTVFGSVNSTDIANLEVSLPPLLEQKRISAVLSALDEKIAVNNKINHNLEQTARAVYENMFADMLTGANTTISEIIDVRDGTHDSPKSVDFGFPLVTSKHLLPYGADIFSPNKISQYDFSKINERSRVDYCDILYSMIGTIGIVSLVIDNPVKFAIKNIGLFKTSQKREYAYFVLCYLRCTEISDYINARLAGSTQKYISLGELRQLPITSPTKNQLDEFNLSVSPLFQEIEKRTIESCTIANLRDNILPQLMSGTLSVNA